MSVNIFGSSGGNRSSVGNNKYVDQKFATLSTNLATKVNNSGDTVSGDLNILLNEDNLRSFGVTDIKEGKSVSLLLGDISNQIRHNYGHNIKVYADHGTKFTCPAGDVCLLGAQTNSKAQFLSDVVMNDKCITNLHDPKSEQDAATKNYVDTRYFKNNVGYVPELVSNDRNKCGFVVSASSEISTEKRVYNVFNLRRSDWCANTADIDFWILLQCPEPVRIHKFALRGNRANDKIYNWKLQASNDNIGWNDLYVEAKDKFIDDSVSIFNVNPSKAYSYYKIFASKAVGEMYGLSYWQLYTLDEIMTIHTKM